VTGARVHEATIEVATTGKGFVDVTAKLAKVVASSGVTSGLANVFLAHTSASLVIQENADPSVLRDLDAWIEGLAPDSRRWEHDAEGPDDMPSHARSAITKTSESIPIRAGKLALGTWQALYLWEHRTAPHRRTLLVTVIGV
jgi:secondary thiamine-phosphate synthase enzyme